MKNYSFILTIFHAVFASSILCFNLAAYAGAGANVKICIRQTWYSNHPSDKTYYRVNSSSSSCMQRIPNTVEIEINNSQVGSLVCKDAGLMETRTICPAS